MDDKCEFKKYFMKGLFLFLRQMGGLASKHFKSSKKGKQNFLYGYKNTKCYALCLVQIR
jgi:hypothetical protein